MHENNHLKNIESQFSERTSHPESLSLTNVKSLFEVSQRRAPGQESCRGRIVRIRIYRGKRSAHTWPTLGEGHPEATRLGIFGKLWWSGEPFANLSGVRIYWSQGGAFAEGTGYSKSLFRSGEASGFLLEEKGKPRATDLFTEDTRLTSGATTYFHSYSFGPGGAVPLPPPLHHHSAAAAASANAAPGFANQLLGAGQQQACNLACTCTCTCTASIVAAAAAQPRLEYLQHHHHLQHLQHRPLGTATVLLHPVDRIKNAMVSFFWH